MTEESLSTLPMTLGALMNTDTQKALWKYATGLTRSSFVPELFRADPSNPNDPAPYNAMVAVDFSLRMNRPVLEIMAGMYQPGRGKAFGWTTQFYLSQMRRAEVIVGPPRYRTRQVSDKMIGSHNLPDIAVTVTVIDGATDEEVSWSMSMAQAYEAGWAKRSTRSPNYPSRYEIDPVGMLGNRALTALVKKHYPETLYGLSTQDELMDEEIADTAVEVVDTKTGIDRIVAGPAPRVVETEEPEVVVAEVVDEPAVSDMTEATRNQVLDWMQQEGIDEGRIMGQLKDGFSRASVEELMESEAVELLGMIQSGDFDKIEDPA